MRWYPAATVVLLLALPCALVATADVTDLSNGVFITHHPPELQFSGPPPPEDWCQQYHDNYGIDCCSQQNTTVGEIGSAVWYVLSAWEEEKEFCGVQFGLGDFDPWLFGFVEYDICPPPGGQCLPPITTDGWPGPNEGIVYVVCGEPYVPWTGNFVPVYCFAGYTYAEGVIPLRYVDEWPFPYAGWGNCGAQPELYQATCLGALGILTDGSECCPEGGPSPPRQSSWGTLKQLYR